MNDTAIQVVYVTFPDEDEAKRVVGKLLRAKHIACANSFPINSMYTWNGKFRTDAEVGVYLKTTQAKVATLLDVLPSLHSYEVPCIVVLPVSAVHLPFQEWIKSSVE